MCSKRHFLNSLLLRCHAASWVRVSARAAPVAVFNWAWMATCSARVGLDDGLQTTTVCALRRLASGTLPGRGGEAIGRSWWASAAPAARITPMAANAHEGAPRRDVMLNPPLSV